LGAHHNRVLEHTTIYALSFFGAMTSIEQTAPNMSEAEEEELIQDVKAIIKTLETVDLPLWKTLSIVANSHRGTTHDAFSVRIWC
jgi:hypothetical protein